MGFTKTSMWSMFLELPKTLNKFCGPVYFSRVSFYQILKGIEYTKNTLEASPLISGTRKGFLLLPPLFNHILKFLANALRQETEMRNIKLSYFRVI